MEKSNENKLNALVGHSGNSDVDLVVNIDINTKAIAYGMLCSLYAKGELTELQLVRAVEVLDKLIRRDKRRRKSKKNLANENKPALLDPPEQSSRRNRY
ncbi:hypothetical protein R4Z09_28155 [Niallia oryzisoli]|uniref:Uncharacterized protein n=1 Tax=Niallia oryzisoli TaxID=1737571 RepID=A0ABZ2CBC4_9BACI